MVGVVRSAEHMALSGAPVLIFGEPGTGRATLARHIHWRSRHFGQPFVSVNCRSFPRNFLEQNFLGTGKSIFSGLLAQCTGRAEAIEGAVLLLNDVDQLDISAQTLILQGMREQEEEDAPRRAKIRIFATSSGELRDAVSRLTFLSDLYFRLNVLSLSMPRLRDRRDDIAPLSKYFAHRHAATYRCPNYRVSHAAIGKLTTYPWFGNVLELNNVMHRAVLHAKGPEIDSDDIDLDFSTCALPRNMANDHDPDRAFIPRRLEDIERSAIIDTLGHTRGNRRDAANILGMPIRTMHTRIHGYMSLGLRVPPPTPRIAA
jgi:two-component system response regulator FlrC